MNNLENMLLRYTRKFNYFRELSGDDKEMLSSVGIDASALSERIYSIECLCFNKVRHGIGTVNINGGIEFINLRNMKCPVTLRRYGITVIPAFRKRQSVNCCLFYSIVDYMAFMTLQQCCSVELPKDCDSIILNSPNNIISMIVESEDYNKSYAFFHNDNIGNTLVKTLEHRNPGNVVNCGHIYKSFKSLMDFHRHLLRKSKKKDGIHNSTGSTDNCLDSGDCL